MKNLNKIIQKQRREIKNKDNTLLDFYELLKSYRELEEILKERIVQEQIVGNLRRNVLLSDIALYNLKGPLYRLFHKCPVGERDD